MTNQELQNLITSWNAELDFTEENSSFLSITVKPLQLQELMRNLKENANTAFDYLFCLTGMDWGKDLGVIYHLESTKYRHQLVVKTMVEDRENPVLETVSNIWRTADFHEREVYDFFGIIFNNHPNLKRLFLTDDWEGFPLRKDYVDETNMVIK